MPNSNRRSFHPPCTIGVWTHHYITTCRTCLCGGNRRSFHPPCTDIKHTQALHEMQNAPLWVQHQRPGNKSDLSISTSTHQVCWLWLLPTWSHMHVPLTFFQKSCAIAKGRRNQLNMALNMDMVLTLPTNQCISCQIVEYVELTTTINHLLLQNQCEL